MQNNTHTKVTKVLAFDPGFERLGVAVVVKENGKEILLHSECIRTSHTLTFPERLYELGVATEALIKTWIPDAIAIEEVFFASNAKTVMKVSEVCGMLSYLALKHELQLFKYTPLQVKVATTGYGKSDKAAVSMMISRLVSLPIRKRLDDELDAIAVGLTCLASLR